MIKVKRLRFGAIGRFVDPQLIEFDELGNLVQIDGENRNTGGSSGSAKTTILNALDFLLGLNSLPTTVLQSRLTKEKMWIEGDFDWDGKDLSISRSAKLAITIDGQVTTGSSAISEEKLDEILGMPRDLFRKILHKRQKEGGFFLNFKPSEMYDFLTDALSLAQERKKVDKIDLKIKELDIKKTASFHKLNNVRSSLKATQEAILSLGLPPIRNIHQNIILELKGRYDATQNRFKGLEELQKSETKELEESRPKTSVSAYDDSNRNTCESRLRELNAQLSEYSRSEAARIAATKAVVYEKSAERARFSVQLRDAVSAKLTATELANQIKKIRESICPTCEQGWITEHAHSKEEELLQKLMVCKQTILVGTEAQKSLDLIDQELVALNNDLIPIEDPLLPQIKQQISAIEEEIKEERKKADLHNAAQNSANSVILQSFAAKQLELRTIHARDINQVRGQLDVDRRTFEAAVQKLKAFEQAEMIYKNSSSAVKTNEALYLGQLEIEEEIFTKLEKELVKAEKLKKAVKLFISCAFDDALEEIGTKSTEIIRCIPTMSNATIQFESQRVTGEGKVKEEVSAVISTDGHPDIPIKSLSGGERQAVDLAVDLAVIEYVEDISGKGINIYIMDEPCTSLDDVNIEQILEMIKNLKSGKRIIIVEHNPIIKQMVTDKVIVIRDGEFSRIKSKTETSHVFLEANNG